MGDERALSALARIERALARVEAAARRTPRPAADDESALAAAHESLRSRVEEAIVQIDRLLETAEAG